MPIPSSEVALYRAALRDVDALAQRDLLRAWRVFDLSDAESVRDGLMDVLPALLATYHTTAATVAADWYDLMRVDAGVQRRFSALMPDPPSVSRAHAMARWGVAPLFRATPAPAVVLSKLAGGVQRVVTDGARDTVATSSLRDPARPGWLRVGTGRCDWCRERVGLRIRDSVVFESHDACGCTAVPAFD